MTTVLAELPSAPVPRGADESQKAFGIRRAEQLRSWVLRDHVPVEQAAAAHGMSPRATRSLVYGQNRTFASRPRQEDLDAPPITLEQAWREEPLIFSSTRLTADQSYQRALLFYRWHQAGMSMTDIGKRHGISRERVTKLLLKHGFPRTFVPSVIRGTYQGGQG